MEEKDALPEEEDEEEDARAQSRIRSREVMRRRAAYAEEDSLKDMVARHKQMSALRIAQVLKGMNASHMLPIDAEGTAGPLGGGDSDERPSKSGWYVSETPMAAWDYMGWATESIKFGDVLAKHMKRRIWSNKRKRDEKPTAECTEVDVYNLLEEDVKAIVQDMAPDLVHAIMDGLQALEPMAYAGNKDNNNATSKFVQDDITLTSQEGDQRIGGKLTLTEAIGTPSSSPLTGMYSEHCQSMDSETVFSVDAYGGISTTPSLEWEFVAGPEAIKEDGHFNIAWTPGNLKPFPDDIASRPAKHGKPGGREQKPIHELLKWDTAKKAKLTAEEVIALRLVTGPMLWKYRAALSGQPFSIASKMGGNSYSTTIHTALKGMLKISEVTPLPNERKAFMALDHATWKSDFWTPDSLGCTGALCRGFLSGSLSRQVALGTISPDSRHRPIILELEMGKTCMATDVKFLSQYPHENEILLPPCTYLDMAPSFRLEEGVCITTAQPDLLLGVDEIERNLESRKGSITTIGHVLMGDAKRAGQKVGINTEKKLNDLLHPLELQVQKGAAANPRVFDSLYNFNVYLTSAIEVYSGVCKDAVQIVLDDANEHRSNGDGKSAVRAYRLAIDIATNNYLDRETKEMALLIRTELVSMLNDDVSGLSNLDVATIKNELGVDLRQEGEYEVALRLCQEALDIRTKELGAENVMVANTMNNLANVYQSMGDNQRALSLYEEALVTTVGIVGRDHEHVASELNNMALVNKRMGHFDKAAELYKESLDLRVRLYGKQSPEVAASIYNLGSLFAQKGERLKALPLFEKAAAIYTECFGPGHPDTKDAARKADRCRV